MKWLIAFIISIIVFSIWIFMPFIRFGASILGFNKPRNYVILFQNTMELRPSGGFMGSYAEVTIYRAHIQSYTVQDIYVPDGQLDGHVNPPWPIQAAFGQGWYKLRDSNWDVDFSLASKTISWFFEHGKQKKNDGLIAVNLFLPIDVLKISGPLHLLDDTTPLTSATFYQQTQSAVEKNFFPGSIQKQSYLSSVASALVENMKEWGIGKRLRLLGLLLQLIQQKQILVSMSNATEESFIHRFHADGSLENMNKRSQDYFSFFESNLGANKANCCIDRSVHIKLLAEGGSVLHTVLLSYTNKNPSSLKHPPQSWGGAYVDYLRLVLPIDAQLQQIQVGSKSLLVPTHESIDTSQVLELLTQQATTSGIFVPLAQDTFVNRVDIELRPDKALKIVGFFVLVDALERGEVKLVYSIPRKQEDMKEIYIQKQSGIESIPYQFSFGNNTLSKQIFSDTSVKIQ